ncbi:hypothetical protein B0H16DRAFT_344869 [Mycena metata]|uniref:DUF6534 domain-containing protein n=1 Tax=Mycena metata TaxID=1033252 RepID=A0AAD7MLM6_9AGAR|nr:hypothetical protein B0H16DRAFT_344869 [Mycena metata]
MYGGGGHARTLNDVQKVVPLAIFWTVATAVCDVAIATSLVWTLRGMKTTFKDTDRLLRRVMMISVWNGLTTSLAATEGMLGTIILPYSTRHGLRAETTPPRQTPALSSTESARCRSLKNIRC